MTYMYQGRNDIFFKAFEKLSFLTSIFLSRIFWEGLVFLIQMIQYKEF